MNKLVVLSGAGISAESGIKTFRDAGGLWEGHDVYEVASPEGFAKNPSLVLDFYNQRRKQARQCQPNAGHLSIAALEKHFDVHVVTQNVDNLHEKAGSKNVLHLHGELFKSRSTVFGNLIYNMEGDEINPGDLCEKGAQLRPHIVWFGEAVPEFERAARIVSQADVLVIVGTSLLVYPANTLIQYALRFCPIYLVDPQKPAENFGRKIEYILKPASLGMPELAKILISNHAS